MDIRCVRTEGVFNDSGTELNDRSVVNALGDLCSINRAELLKFRNFGKKSLTELDAKLASLNLSFGMDLSKYKLDKE